MPQQLTRAFVAALSIAVCLTAAARAEDKKSDKDAIVGKWELSKTEGEGDKKTEIKIAMEFTKDGKVKMGMRVKVADMEFPVNMDGTYKWADKDHIEVTMKDPKSKKEETKKLKAKVTAKELELTDPDEKDKKKATLKFTKAK